MNINQVDLIVRLQLAGCKYSELANTYANNLKYGMKCSKKNLQNLFLLNSLLEILECYTIIYDKPGLIYQEVNQGGLSPGDIVNILANGITISGDIDITDFGMSEQVTQIVEAINSYQSDFVASSESTDRKEFAIKLLTPCTNPDVSITIDDGNTVVEIPIEYQTLGECNIDHNCFTEEQLLSIIDNIAALVKLCFQPIGFNYEIPEGYALNEETGELTPD